MEKGLARNSKRQRRLGKICTAIQGSARTALYPGVIHFALVCGSLSRHRFRTRVALRRATKNIEIRGRPRVANELVDGLERLIVLRKANERTT